jgi:hypothetical protein
MTASGSAFGAATQFTGRIELAIDRRGDELENPARHQQAHHHADHETLDRAHQVRAQIFDVLAERHARIGKHVVGVGVVVVFHGGHREARKPARKGGTLIL